MRHIAKGREPRELVAWRAQPGAAWDGGGFTTVKDEIRKALVRDQAYLCAYCMRRIDAEPEPGAAPPSLAMKVEHWRPQSRAPELALAWSNLLGVCNGGVGVPPADQTCDTRKGDHEIVLDPQSRVHIATLSCRSTGRLVSSVPRLQEDLDLRLGLNHRILVSERRGVIDRAIAWLHAHFADQGFRRGVLRAIAQAEAPHAGRAPAFCGTLRLWARGRFRDEIAPVG